jgi:hypothetical protein
MDAYKLTDFISRNNQYNTHSDLWPAIKTALNCTDREAIGYAKTHCNLISFYALLYCQGLIKLSYSNYFRVLLDTDAVKANGYIKVYKEDILKIFGIRADIIDIPISTNDKYPEGYYQIKITNPHGTHFIAAYSHGDWLYIADTNDRGVGVSIVTGLKNNDKLSWIKQVKPASTTTP